tara:strand:+ start:1618 stop:1962 length:345 start_codon:yes stop_codon:yes gene_type:complete
MSIGKKYLGMIRRGLGASLNRQNWPVEAQAVFLWSLALLTLASAYVLCLLVLLPVILVIEAADTMRLLVVQVILSISWVWRLILALAILIAICFYAWPLNKGGQALASTTLFYI